MHQPTVLSRVAHPGAQAETPRETEGALDVAVVYQDSLTRYWVTGLWSRVGRLIGDRTVRHNCWLIGDLTRPGVFEVAVQAAAKADVLVVSLRDAGRLPREFHAWIDAWLPRRAGRAGALVALIGMPAQLDVQSGRAYQFLAGVARSSGLDFFPRERKLPEEYFAYSTLGKARTVSQLYDTGIRIEEPLRVGSGIQANSSVAVLIWPHDPPTSPAQESVARQPGR